MSPEKRRKNLVILYATIFSVVGFVVIVVVCVVVSGCSKAGLNTSFKFNKQLDQELGTFKDIPRAKLRTNTNNNDDELSLPTTNHVGTGVDGVDHPPVLQGNGHSGSVDVDDDTGAVLDEGNDKSIENKGYVDDEGPLDSDCSSTP